MSSLHTFISAIVVIVFWLTSKVTAHHPEDAEEIKT
jgi:hypothetical protein